MTGKLFKLGRVFFTPGALDLLGEPGADFVTLLNKHVSGDWSEMDAEDIESNRAAVAHGGRIFSAYMIGDKKIWIITEADRSVTTLLLPEEY